MNTSLVLTGLCICFILMLTITRAEQKVDADHKIDVPSAKFASFYGHDDFFDNADEHELEKRRFNAWAGKRSLTKRRFNAWAGR